MVKSWACDFQRAAGTATQAPSCGDVRYEVLEMHPGAMIDGELKPLKSAEKPALKLAASNDA